MQTLPFALTQDDAKQPAIGLIVLQSDETMEHELHHLLPAHYRLFHTRIANSQTIEAGSLQAMKAQLPVSASLLPAHTNYQVIAYGCTSAATVIGEAAITDAVQSVHKGTQVTNPLSAIKANLRALGALRIGLLTPYAPQVSQALYDSLTNSGFSIVSSGTFNESQDHNVARISHSSILDGVQSIGNNQPLDALFISCTNLRTEKLLSEASQIAGCPVVSSNSALAWHIQSLVSEFSDS